MADDKTQALLARLDQGIAELTSTEAWTRWLDTQRRFHQYSFGNTLLIALQRPDASRVAGFRTWLSLGRHVRKGEKGIAILAPIVHRSKTVDEVTGEETVHVSSPSNFRVAHVFDTAQTEGEELPDSPCQRLTGDDPDGAYDRLVAVARSIGWTVQEDFLPGEVNGLCTFYEQLITVDPSNEPRQMVKTLAHELGHAFLHTPAIYTGGRELAELEAESVAFIVMSTLGIDSGSYSFGYVAGWSGGGQEATRRIAASAQRISKAARQILNSLNERAEAQRDEAA